jgi:hypothetical protein
MTWQCILWHCDKEQAVVNLQSMHVVSDLQYRLPTVIINTIATLVVVEPTVPSTATH